MKAIKFASIFTLTAVAVAVSPTSFAFDIVKSDDLTINMNGDLDLKVTNTGNGTDIKSNFDDIDFDIKWKIDDSLTFIAASDWTVESDDNNVLFNDQSYVGFKFNDFTVRAGFQEDAIDPLGIEGFELSQIGRASGDQDGGGTKFAQSIVMGYDHDSFTLLASYAKETEGTSVDEVSVIGDVDDAIEDSVDAVYDAESEVPSRLALYAKTKIKTEIGDFQIEGGIGQEENLAETTETNFWQLQAEYFVGPMTLGVLYSSMEVDQVDPTNDDYDSTGIEFNVNYEVNDKLDLFVGYETINNGITGTDNYAGKAIGASYTFSKLVKAYLEVGNEEGTYIRGGSINPRTTTRNDVNLVGMLVSVDF